MKSQKLRARRVHELSLIKLIFRAPCEAHYQFVWFGFVRLISRLIFNRLQNVPLNPRTHHVLVVSHGTLSIKADRALWESMPAEVPKKSTRRASVRSWKKKKNLFGFGKNFFFFFSSLSHALFAVWFYHTRVCFHTNCIASRCQHI